MSACRAGANSAAWNAQKRVEGQRDEWEDSEILHVKHSLIVQYPAWGNQCNFENAVTQVKCVSCELTDGDQAVGGRTEKRSRVTGGERLVKRWAICIWMPPDCLYGRCQTERGIVWIKKTLKRREVHDSVLDDDHEEWLTSSSNARQRFLQTHLQHLILPPAQHAVTRQQHWMEHSCTKAAHTMQQHMRLTHCNQAE